MASDVAIPTFWPQLEYGVISPFAQAYLSGMTKLNVLEKLTQCHITPLYLANKGHP